MDYQQLTKKDQAQFLKSAQLDLERQHHSLSTQMAVIQATLDPESPLYEDNKNTLDQQAKHLALLDAQHGIVTTRIAALGDLESE